MKKMLMMLMMTLGLAILSVSNGIAEDPRAMTTLTGYSLKTKPGPRSDFNIWVVTHESAFDEEFIAGQDAKVKPDFEKQLVVAVHAETTNYSYQVLFERSVADKDGLHVYFRVKKERPGTESGGVSVATLEKTNGLKAVHFYHDNIRVRTIPIVSVY